MVGFRTRRPLPSVRAVGATRVRTSPHPYRSRRAGLVACLAGTVLAAPMIFPIQATRAAAMTRWVTTWAPPPMPPAIDDALFATALPSDEVANQSLRMIVQTTSPSRHIRVRLTNRYGNRPITFGPVRVALRRAGPAEVAGSTRQVAFGGRSFVTVPPGGEVVSDPVAFLSPAGAHVAITMHVVNTTGAVTWHRFGNWTTYISGENSGDHTADESGASYRADGVSYFWLDGLDTDSSDAGTIVALGDSITDGWPVAPDQGETWPDVLAARLNTPGSRVARAVVNAGIAGNQVSGDYPCSTCGASALARIGHDVFALTDVRDVIIFEGTNDLAAGKTAATVIARLARLAALGRNHGLRVLGATITPRSDTGWTPSMEGQREIVNQWIRTTHAFDGFFDFDATLRDPLDQHRLRPDYNSGDSLHPNILGLKALGDSINPAAFA